ncbi:polysaccharide deacetylase family protein [Yoonia sp.]|uniref:polysaccharide deacetylase family protein n=1 Tax=Yoonia sp. TaxID=2212373 RepID=UPI0025E58764|nr:polysaccharide deacetylase family protein [Yoonia sp.]
MNNHAARRYLLAVAAIAAIGLGLVVLGPHLRIGTEGSPAPKRGIVTITFDDAGLSQYDVGLRVARAEGVVGTLFVPTGLVTDANEPSWVMSWDQIRDFRDAGWEIGAHGAHHLPMTQLGPTTMESELTDPIDDIGAQIGVPPVSFSSPFGDFNDTTITRIMAYYDYQLSWKGHGGRNPIPDIDPRYIGRLEVIPAMSSAEVCGEMVRAAETGTWLVLLFHTIVAGEPVAYEVSEAVYTEVVTCLGLLTRRGVVENMTVRDAMALITAQERMPTQ